MRQLYCFNQGDTLLGDTLYASYPIVATALQKNIHVVAEIRPSRMKRLGKKITDKVVKLEKGYKHSSLSKEKQIWMHMIVYNLVRMCIAEAGLIGGKLPRHLSFRAAQQFVAELLGKDRPSDEDLVLLYAFILANPVGQRPDRSEPRATKSRKKNYALLREPRNIAAQRLHKKSKVRACA